MSIQIYNTQSKEKEILETVQPGKVHLYTCGPTVYDYFHVGNARAFLVFDAFRSYLQYRGYQVTFVQNFTDIDDKIIQRAKLEGLSPKQVADKYIAAYFEDSQALGIHKADVHPRVTEHMQDIIDYVQTLVEQGAAYEVKGDVYFDVSKSSYGQLSNQSVEDLISGSRVEVNTDKKNPVDFALWKAQKNSEEIAWDSPWGKGRPGWHIECSVMSQKYLGDTIDIHAGGHDLIFPHHENEKAQSETKTGKPFVRYWMHNGYINIDNQKMSKSLGNFFTVRDILKEYDAQVIRFFILAAHYRSPINFSRDLIDQAQNGLERIKNAVEKLQFLVDTYDAKMVSKIKQTYPDDLTDDLLDFQKKFIEVMDDDFNTADGISVIFELIKYIHTQEADQSKEWVVHSFELLKELLSVLGLLEMEKKDELSEEIQDLMDQRSQAKKEKDFALADQIRDQLEDMGIELEDTRQGTKWKRK